jgi:hypothetical protein
MRSVTAFLLAGVLVAGCQSEAAGPTAAPPTSPPTAAPTMAPTPAPTLLPATPMPTAAGSPSAIPPTASPSLEPVPEAYSINLYREGAFVSEYTVYYCLPAAMQVMINIMSDGPPDSSRQTQDRLYTLARELDGYEFPRRVRDVEPEGWAEGLNIEGYGPYVVHAEPTLEEAISVAARQLRLTGKPVGLLTWRGAHSWVMSGFEASADPLLWDEFEVTGVWIQDVWWPRISTRWGESDPPNTLVPVERLPQDYKRYRRPYGEFPGKDGMYVMVIPLADAS